MQRAMYYERHSERYRQYQDLGECVSNTFNEAMSLLDFTAHRLAIFTVHHMAQLGLKKTSSIEEYIHDIRHQRTGLYLPYLSGSERMSGGKKLDDDTLYWLRRLAILLYYLHIPRNHPTIAKIREFYGVFPYHLPIQEKPVGTQIVQLRLEEIITRLRPTDRKWLIKMTGKGSDPKNE